MQVAVTTDPGEFSDRAFDFLSRDPVRNTLILSNVAARVGGAVVDTGPSYFFTVHVDGAVAGAAMQTSGRGAVLTSVPDEYIVPVAANLAGLTTDVPFVDGTRSGALTFARYWGTAFALTHDTRLYELGELTPAAASGSARLARPDEADLCDEWARATLAEINDPAPTDLYIPRRIADGTVWLWEDAGGPVSLAAMSVPAGGVVRIGPVYTPPTARGHGYASALTSVVSAQIVERGLRACLFADIANRTSNKIYAAIGYRPVADFARYSLAPSKGFAPSPRL